MTYDPTKITLFNKKTISPIHQRAVHVGHATSLGYETIFFCLIAKSSCISPPAKEDCGVPLTIISDTVQYPRRALHYLNTNQISPHSHTSGTRWTCSNYRDKRNTVRYPRQALQYATTTKYRPIHKREVHVGHAVTIETKETQCGTRDKHSITSTPIQISPIRQRAVHIEHTTSLGVRNNFLLLGVPVYLPLQKKDCGVPLTIISYTVRYPRQALQYRNNNQVSPHHKREVHVGHA